MNKVDEDVLWAVTYATDEADMSSELSGSDSDLTKCQRRLETVIRRLAREAGYDIPLEAAT